MELNYKNKLSFSESLAMIDEVYITLFESDPETGAISYFPELYDYAYRLAIARYYGGYLCTGVAEEDYSAAMDVDINSLDIDDLQLSGIEEAILQKIEMKKAEMNRANILVASKFDEIINPIVGLLNTLTNTIETFDINNLDKILGSSNMKNLMENYLKPGIDENHLMKLINATKKTNKEPENIMVNEGSSETVTEDN
ncbi:hypothetical protein [Clostridium transplantifaecale]|uniref:hypothetical protein n=1 Tax=Clostridium transplantifaecale TaxID=2479838 RepID=UPI000F639472|nr:hypothetical protein [Clostridium transplantifaecale]